MLGQRDRWRAVPAADVPAVATALTLPVPEGHFGPESLLRAGNERLVV